MEKINVEKFIKGYFKAGDKAEYIKSHIVTYYMPYMEKCAICEKIADVTTYKTVGKGKNEQRIYWDNTSSRLILTYLQIINYYTDIEVVFTDGKYVKVYDELNGHYTSDDYSTNLFEDLINAIPRTEVEIFMNMTKNIAKDIRTNETNIVNYADTKYQAIKLFFDKGEKKISKKLNKILSNENITNKIEQMIDKELTKTE